MKRLWISIAAVLLTMAMAMTVSAEAALTYVTELEYSHMVSGGVDDTMIYRTTDASGALVMGQLTADGEQTRVNFSAAEWNALFAEDEWETAVTGTASALCPYADTHRDNTVCPYLDISCVTITNDTLGVTLENYYVPKVGVTLLPSGSVHFCWGRYGFEAPLTLKWDGQNRYFALKNDVGLWGVFDAQSNAMSVDYSYQDMGTVYGDYVKVFNGTAWGRLDLSGAYETEFIHENEADFSVREELREIADGQYCVFNADNRPISEVIAVDAVEVSYAAEAHVMYALKADKTTDLIGLDGNVIATFNANQTVRHLQDACYAVEQYTADEVLEGIALAHVDNAVQPPTCGDVNFDGEVDSRDSRLMLRSLVNTATISGRQVTAADMDNNGALETDDVRAHMRALIA